MVIAKRDIAKATATVLAIALFSISLAFIASAEIVEKPRPIITITFDEPVLFAEAMLEKFNGYSGDGNYIELENISDDPENKVLKYRPYQNLENQNEYVFTITATDAGGQRGEPQQKYFYVEIPALKISYYNPRLGVSPTENFDFVITTDREANECRYSVKLPGESGYKVYRDMSNIFVTSTNRMMHTLAGIKMKQGDAPVTYFVSCKDDYGIINEPPKVFNLSVDMTNPVISSTAAEPDEIIFYSVDHEKGRILKTDLVVQTDDESICKASETANNYNAMEKFFEKFNASNKDAFAAESKRNLTDYADGTGGVFEQKKYTFNIACENLAGLVSNISDVSFLVNLSKALRITGIRPMQEIKTEQYDVGFIVDTNKASTCNYGSNASRMIYPFEGSETEHVVDANSNEVTLRKGTNKIYVICIYLYESAETTITIIVDDSEPEMEYVNVTDSKGDYTEEQWQLDTIRIAALAIDAESGISEYLFAVMDAETEKIVSDWKSYSKGSATISGLKLEDKASYIVIAKAKNGVGKQSDIMESEPLYVDITTKPKEASKCSNTFKDSEIGETDVDCGGELCKPCSEGESCIFSMDCEDGFVCLGDICVDENALPCGADKDERCDTGKGCKINNDCKSDFCSNGTCDLPGCFDGLRNGKETALDCGGGACDPCGKGMSCLSDSDCITDKCSGDEDKMLCAGKALGESCASNAECESDICDHIILQCVVDSDSDGMPDWWEKEYFGDEYSAIADEDTDADGYTNLQEYNDKTDPVDPKSHKKVPCSADSDCDEGFMCDIYESCAKDTDGDKLPDWWEMQYFECIECAVPNEDSDNEKLSNKDEYLAKSDPGVVDTDGDKYDDYREVMAGTDPVDPTDHPISQLGKIIFMIVLIIALGAGGFLGYKYYLKNKIEEIRHSSKKDMSFEGPRMSATRRQTAAESRKSEADLHKIFVEKQKEKQSKFAGVFDAFGKEKPKEAKSEEKESTKTKKVFEGFDAEDAKKSEKAEKEKRTSGLFDKLSGLSIKGKESGVDRLESLSKGKKKGDTIDSLASSKKEKEGRADRLSSLGKSKKSSLDSLVQQKKEKPGARSLESLRKKNRK